jgi:pimeloyl-ACP methyl ester carboxylesterase
MQKLAVIVLHGIGSYAAQSVKTKPGFDTPLRDAMRKRLGGLFDRVEWERIVWSAPELEDRQQKLIEARDAPRTWRWLFDFAASGLGDASAHTLPLGSSYSGSYFTVQSAVRDQLRALEARLGADAATTPVLAVAHSLGCHVLSCYAWDAAHDVKRIVGPDAPPGELTPFQSLATLAGLVFVGCNLPLVTMNVRKDALLPMRLALRPPVLAGKESVWLNFYEGSDPLGYRLADEYSAYFEGGHAEAANFAIWRRDPASERRPVDREVTMRSLSGLTPIAHSKYYQSRTVLDSVEAAIREFLR